jgi:hypothetical protein
MRRLVGALETRHPIRIDLARTHESVMEFTFYLGLAPRAVDAQSVVLSASLDGGNPAVLFQAGPAGREQLGDALRGPCQLLSDRLQTLNKVPQNRFGIVGHFFVL